MLKRWLEVALSMAVVFALTAFASTLSAQPYPSRPVRIIVLFTPGGSSDVLTRLVAQEMSESLGQSFIIENRTGAGGNLGAECAAKSPADGYTLLSGSSSLPLAPSLFSKLGYSPMTDFVPITLLGASPMIVTVNPSFPVKSVAELIALAKQKPGEIAYASAGVGA